MKASLCLWLLVAAGCYTYEPIQSPSPGTEVRARLTTEAAIRHSQGLENPVRNVSGRVVGFTSDTLAVDVLVARTTSVFRDVTIRDTVHFGTNEIESIEARHLAPARTALLVAGAGAGAYLIVRGITSVIGGDTGDGDPGPPPALVVPLFSLPVH